MSFKETVEADRDAVFLNPDYYGETHEVAGKEIICVIDSDDHVLHLSEYGIDTGNKRLFAKTEDLPKRRKAGVTLEVDGVIYGIQNWQDDMGISSIALLANY